MQRVDLILSTLNAFIQRIHKWIWKGSILIAFYGDKPISLMSLKFEGCKKKNFLLVILGSSLKAGLKSSGYFTSYRPTTFL